MCINSQMAACDFMFDLTANERLRCAVDATVQSGDETYHCSGGHKTQTAVFVRRFCETVAALQQVCVVVVCICVCARFESSEC